MTRFKDVGNDQSQDDNRLTILHNHLRSVEYHMQEIRKLVGLQSGSVASGSSGSGSQDGVKYSKDPELALTSLRQELRQARETAARRGVKVI
jgi:hypothetical protein